MGYNAVTVTGSATQIVAANPMRKEVNILNYSDVMIVYIGPDSSVTVQTGFPVYANQNFSNKINISEHWKGPIYGILAGGTSSVRYWEVTQ